MSKDMSDAEANQRYYQGNSVSFLKQRVNAYGAAIDRAFAALLEAGYQPDGKSELAELIRAALAAKPVAPIGWRAVIDNHCDRLLDTEPSSYDSQEYRDFARSVLDSVADELAAMEADPATKRQEAEAIKAEFLERTGQYLTNDASREACIAEAVAAEREACAMVCEGMHEEDRPHHYADAIRGRDPVPFVPLTTDGERLHFLLDQLTGWGDRTEEVNSYLHDEEGFPLPRGHALASIDAARAKAAAKETP